VLVYGHSDDHEIRTFSTFKKDIKEMVDWLVELRVEQIAMESTGVYWRPAYNLLDEPNLNVILVNARKVKNVPERKTDRSAKSPLYQFLNL
jgi:transposase